MRARILIGALLLPLLAGCGGPGLVGPATGTVTGHVTLRVCGGAYRLQQTPCPIQPLGTATVTFQAGGSSSASRATTDSSGAYRIDLAPGTYVVDVTRSAQTTNARINGPRQVIVTAGKTVTADFTYAIELM